MVLRSQKIRAWLTFFRIVNLPTVPGDVLVGAAAVGACSTRLAVACVASVFLYLFGLADNDIVGAPTDGPERPIPAGTITLAAARLARGLCLFAVMILGAVANLPPDWWIAAFLLAVTVVVYNRTKCCFMMGLCRGLNVVCGAAAVMTGCAELPRLVTVSAMATLYVFFVTCCSEGEETDSAKRRRVGFLIGALVYLQLAALLFFYLSPTHPTHQLTNQPINQLTTHPTTQPPNQPTNQPTNQLTNQPTNQLTNQPTNQPTPHPLITGAVLLILLRLMKRTFPEVSVS